MALKACWWLRSLHWRETVFTQSLSLGSCHPITIFPSSPDYFCDFLQWSIHGWSDTDRKWACSHSVSEWFQIQHRQQVSRPLCAAQSVLCKPCIRVRKLINPFSPYIFHWEQTRLRYGPFTSGQAEQDPHTINDNNCSKPSQLLAASGIRFYSCTATAGCNSRFGGAVPGTDTSVHCSAPLHGSKV